MVVSIMQNKIVNYYSDYNEYRRLRERHSLERIRSEHIISRYITHKPLKILDIGGGPGVYSFWLAEQGHQVTLLDLVPKHIEQAEEYARESGISLESMLIGDACALPFEDNAFDMVLFMGPLYHLNAKVKRMQALSEAKRVLKAQGILIAAAISRYASLIDGLKENFINDPDFMAILGEDLEAGNHENPKGNPNYFTSAHFHLPEELKGEVCEAGFAFHGLYAVECFAGIVGDIEEKLQDETFKRRCLDLLHKIESNPSVIGATYHLMVTGYK